VRNRLSGAGSAGHEAHAERARRPEGGKTGTADRANFYAIARGSALECAAILDVLLRFGAVDSEEAKQGKALLSRVVSMLSKMCR